jgi:hypothetical protein
MIFKLNLRDAITSLDASSAIVTRIIPAAFIASKITGPTSALWLDIDPNSYEGRFVSIDEVRQSADFHNICTRSFASLVLVQALVNAHHCYVDTHFSFNLSIKMRRKKRSILRGFKKRRTNFHETDLFSMLEYNAVEFDGFVIRRAVGREADIRNGRTLLT